jgi:nitroreductase
VEFEDVVRKRRMVRHFKPDPIEPEALERILDLSRRAPSAGNTQGQSLVVVTDPETRKAVGEICGEREYASRFKHHWISEAPVQIIACTSEKAYKDRYSEPDKLQADGSVIEWPVPYWHIDTAFAAMNMLLTVVDHDLGGAAHRHGVHRARPMRRESDDRQITASRPSRRAPPS